MADRPAAAPVVGTPGVVTCVDHHKAAACHRDHETGRCICRPAAGAPTTEPTSELSNEIDKAIWVCAIDRVPIEERVEWTREMRRQYDALAAAGVSS